MQPSFTLLTKSRLFFLYTLLFFVTTTPLFADRWLVLPPRIEGQNTQSFPSASDVARAVALYLKISRVEKIVQVAEAEACLKNAHIRMDQKISASALKDIAKNCMAERMLLMRIRPKKESVEVLSKVYFAESDQLTDTIVSNSRTLNTALGKNLVERFGKSPAAPKESMADLIVVGDTFGNSYFDWPQLKNLFLSVDSQKSAFCYTDSRGQIQTLQNTSDKDRQKQFLDKLTFLGGGEYPSALIDCALKKSTVSREEGRAAEIIFTVSDFPRTPNAQLNLRSQVRRLAGHGNLVFALASNATRQTQLFWQRLAREINGTTFIPLVQRVRVGLQNGTEWFVFRRGSRLYESRTAEKDRFEGGIVIPDKELSSLTNENLVEVYEKLSKNKVISKQIVSTYSESLNNLLSHKFKSTAKGSNYWRVLLEKNTQKYYVSLTANTARQLKENEFVRIYVELLPPTEKEIIVNRASPALVVDAVDSAPSVELDITDYIRTPRKYLRKGIGARSFYILTGKVLQIIPPDADVLESEF
ncbi:MAG: hypothetical protein LDLANPLL_02469 [Turneriella sp.]|nr:hypothetical protein [Turneriella sp.]